MLLIKKLTNINQKYLLLFIFVLLFLLTRLPSLGYDVINPDGVNWHERSELFISGLKSFDLSKTYQHYHPGVTVMWLVGVPVEIVKQLSPADSIYTADNYLIFHQLAKYSLVLSQLIVSLVLIHVLARLYNFKIAFLAVTLLTIEPYFLGNSRVVHLDALVTLFLFVGLTYSYIALKKYSLCDSLLAGVFLSLAFLTKSIAIGGIVFVLGIAFLNLVHTRNRSVKDIYKYMGTLVVGFIVTSIIVFPALLVNPLHFLAEIFTRSNTVGVIEGHAQIFFGKVTSNPGVFFYPFVITMKVTLFTMFGVALFLWSWANSKENSILIKAKNLFPFFRKDYLVSFIYYLTVFYVAYILVMSFPNKKMDRYVVPIFPYLALVAVLGYYKYAHLFKEFKYKVLFTLFFIISFIVPLTSLYPYYFVYTSPLYGNGINANKVVGHKSFGVAIPELKEVLIKEYGCIRSVSNQNTDQVEYLEDTSNYSSGNCINSRDHYPIVGLHDTKPLRVIYGGSKVRDVRIYGPGSFDLLVLAVNEPMPIKVLESEQKFRLDRVIKINSLDYWMIYVKETN